jgi:hypothetical protein
MKKIFSILLSVAALAGFSACSDGWDADSAGQGQLRTASLGVEVDGAETIVSEGTATQKSAAKANTSASRASATIDLSNFIVLVTSQNGSEVSRWAYKDMPELPTFAAGTYTVTVKSHEVEPAAWNAPYYEGSQSFQIVANKVTEVDKIVCSLANIRVSVSFTDVLRNAFDNPDEVTVKITSEGNNSLTFTPSETRSGYFQALDNLETLRIDFSGSINGYTETFTKTIDNVAKGQHRKITFSLTNNPNEAPEEIGSVTNDGQGITISNDVVEDEPIETDYDWYESNTDSSDRPGGEKFDDPDDSGQGGDEPTEDVIRFESETLNLDSANDATSFPEDGSVPATVDIYADNGFKHLLVEIISDDLTPDLLKEVGLAGSFDLAEPGDLESKLSGSFNFPVGDEIIGKTHVTFDITKFVPLLNMYPGSVHKFRITATDSKDNVKAVTLTFNT